MRIVKKPERVLPKLGEHGSNTTHPILMITCDDGKTYTVDQLAKVIGTSRQKLVYQLRHLGWKDPLVLDPNYGRIPPRRTMSGNEAWLKLSDESRLHRLHCFVPTGSLER